MSTLRKSTNKDSSSNFMVAVYEIDQMDDYNKIILFVKKLLFLQTIFSNVKEIDWRYIGANNKCFHTKRGEVVSSLRLQETTTTDVPHQSAQLEVGARLEDPEEEASADVELHPSSFASPVVGQGTLSRAEGSGRWCYPAARLANREHQHELAGGWLSRSMNDFRALLPRVTSAFCTHYSYCGVAHSFIVSCSLLLNIAQLCRQRWPNQPDPVAQATTHCVTRFQPEEFVPHCCTTYYVAP